MAKNQMIIMFLSLCSFLLICGCTDKAVEEQKDISKLVSYEKSDYYSPWQEDTFTLIQLKGITATIDGNDGAVVEGNQIFIYTTGTYVFEGALDDGQIIVDTKDSGNVRLVFNGATIHSSTTSPIYIKQADKTIITLEENTINTLTDASEYVYENVTDQPTATIYSKDDLTINGPGTLTIKSHFNDAINCNDDLKITGGTIDITAPDDGIIGSDLLAIKDAIINLTVGGDGLKSTNHEVQSKGHIVLESGTFTINAGGDGIQSEKIVAIRGGKYTITTGGGGQKRIETSEEISTGTNFNDRELIEYLLHHIEVSDEVKKQLEGVETYDKALAILQANPEMLQQISIPMPSDSSSFSDKQMNGSMLPQFSTASPNPVKQPLPQEEMNSPILQNNRVPSNKSTKGIKAGTSISIMGGTFNINSLDDAIHGKDIFISDGIIHISTEDDAIHADDTVTLEGGNVNIAKSYEGIEGKKIIIRDGTYHVFAEDDGVNIQGENSQTNQSNNDERLLLIEGGYLYVNADGDGLDSNGSIRMTGGTVIVYGPTNNNNGPLDYDHTFLMEGGILIAAGSDGKAQGVSNNSSQNTIMMTFLKEQQANTSLYITDSKENEIIAVKPEKEFQSIVISTPDLKLNQTYTLHYGGILSGESIDGLYRNTNYQNGKFSVEFTITSPMTFLHENNVIKENHKVNLFFHNEPMRAPL